ncbi:hypothetical protein D3C72_2122340 [compost metagenome]
MTGSRREGSGVGSGSTGMAIATASGSGNAIGRRGGVGTFAMVLVGLEADPGPMVGSWITVPG